MAKHASHSSLTRRHRHSAVSSVLPPTPGKLVRRALKGVVKHHAKKWRVRKHNRGGGNQTQGNFHGVFERCNTRIAVGKSSIKRCPGTGSYKYFDEFYGTMTSNEGQQGVGWIGTVAHYRDLITHTFGTNSQPALERFGTETSMFNANPNQKVTGSNFYTTGSIPSEDHINLHTVDLHYTFANFSTAACILDVWLVEYKTNSVEEPQTVWAQGLLAQGLAPINATPAANSYSTLGVYGGPTRGYPTPELLGQHPKSCGPWNKQFKVIGEKTFDLSADTNICWNVSVKFNKRLDKQYLIETSKSSAPAVQNTMGYKGLTVALMYRLRGQVIKDTQLTGSNNPSICTARVGYVCSRTYNCSPAPGNRIKTQIALPYLLTGATASGGNEVMEDIRDTIVQVADNI